MPYTNRITEIPLYFSDLPSNISTLGWFVGSFSPCVLVHIRQPAILIKNNQARAATRYLYERVTQNMLRMGENKHVVSECISNLRLLSIYANALSISIHQIQIKSEYATHKLKKNVL